RWSTVVLAQFAPCGGLGDARPEFTTGIAPRVTADIRSSSCMAPVASAERCRIGRERGAWDERGDHARRIPDRSDRPWRERHTAVLARSATGVGGGAADDGAVRAVSGDLAAARGCAGRGRSGADGGAAVQRRTSRVRGPRFDGAGGAVPPSRLVLAGG